MTFSISTPTFSSSSNSIIKLSKGLLNIPIDKRLGNATIGNTLIYDGTKWTYSNDLNVNSITASGTISGKYIVTEPINGVSTGVTLLTSGSGVLNVPAVSLSNTIITVSNTASDVNLPSASDLVSAGLNETGMSIEFTLVADEDLAGNTTVAIGTGGVIPYGYSSLMSVSAEQVHRYLVRMTAITPTPSYELFPIA